MDISKTLDGKITGGHMLARAMAEKGITKVFALCGGFINPIFIGCQDHGIEVIGKEDEGKSAKDLGNFDVPDLDKAHFAICARSHA